MPARPSPPRSGWGTPCQTHPRRGRGLPSRSRSAWRLSPLAEAPQLGARMSADPTPAPIPGPPRGHGWGWCACAGGGDTPLQEEGWG